MAVFDRDLRLVAWNRTFRDMFQLPVEIMRVGVTIEMLVASNAARGIYGQGQPDSLVQSRVDALIRPTEGSRLYSAPFGRVLEMRSVRLDDGGLFLTYTDATARAKTEEELEAENEALEERVRERTELLQTLNFELARAKAEAEDANISKTRFLAAASHDLLQPLNAARLFTASLREHLRHRAIDGRTGELAANIDLSLEAVEEILGALLEISQLDAGATKTEISAFAIGSVLSQLKLEFEPLARQRGLRFEVVPSTLRVRSDRKLLRRLLQNLLSNAIKYTMEGRVLVGVRRCGAGVRIEVCDTGIGIASKHQHLIFREFARLPAAVEVAPGLGLGLSIVARLNRVLGHEISLQSKPDRGSVFSVTLPRADDSPAASATWTLPVAPRQHALDGLTVVAIDNEEHVLAGMEALLTSWSCVVASGRDLGEVEASLADRGLVPDVILADFHVGEVGEVDGIDIVAALRHRYGACAAVLITADRNPAVRERANAADIRVLSKPLKPAALRSLLSQWRLVKASVA